MKIMAMLKERTQHIQASTDELMKRWELRFSKVSKPSSIPFSTIPLNQGNDRSAPLNNEHIQPLANTIEKPYELYSRLKAKVGQEIHVGDWHTVTQECIDEFSKVTGDTQWIHIDKVRASQESPFKSTIAHGLLVLSLLPKLRALEIYSETHYPEARFIVNKGLKKVRFLAPVKPDQEICSRTKLRSVTPHKRGVDIEEEVIIEIKDEKHRACYVVLSLRLYI